MSDNPVIIFDGLCNLCNRAVTFIINRDPQKLFRFTPMQGELATRLVEDYQAPEMGEGALILIQGGESYVRSDAALEIAGSLSGLWPMLTAFRLVPRPVRDSLYSFLARNRYRLFGRRQECAVPASDIGDRFIG